MNYSKYILFTLIGFATVLQSCTDVIDLDLDDTEVLLVVEGEVNDVDSVHWVTLTRSTDYFENQAPDYTAYSNATVILNRNGVAFDTMAFNTVSERFESTFNASLGETYSILIELPDGKLFGSLDETIPRVTPIDTIWVIEEEENDELFWEIYIESQEAPGVGDQYQWKTYINGIYQSEPFDLVFAEDEFVDGNYIEEFNVYTLDEEQYDFYRSLRYPIVVEIVQTGISANNYDFISDLFSQTAISGGPFSPPPAELRGNIESLDGGERALGFFAAVSKESITGTID